MDVTSASTPVTDLEPTVVSRWNDAFWLGLLLTVPLLSVERFYAYNLLALLGLYAYARTSRTDRALSTASTTAVMLCFIVVLSAQLLAEVPQSVAIVGVRDSLRGTFCFILPWLLIRAAPSPAPALVETVVCGLLLLLLGVHGYYVWQVGLDRAELSNAMDAFENRNLWAIAVSATLLLGWVTVLLAHGRRRWWLAIAVLTVALLLHTLNPSRGAMVSTVTVALLLVLVRFVRQRAMVVAAFFLGLLLLQLSYFAWLPHAAPEIFKEIDLWSTWRLTIHLHTVQEILADPLTGYGLRSFSDLIGSRFVTLFGQHIDSPHNLLLDAAYTFGIPATLLLLLVVTRYVGRALRDRLQQAPSFTTLWSLALLAQLAVHGLQEGTLFRPYTLSALAVALALLSKPLVRSPAGAADTTRRV